MEEKSKYVFMQKYYNVGAYYKDMEDPIFQRDYNLPVGEDLWVLIIKYLREKIICQAFYKREGENSVKKEIVNIHI